MSGPRFAFLDHPGPIPFAHRGGAAESPENSWTAFEHARELGYRYMETDVHATSDGVVVAVHDPDLSRTAEVAARVRDLTWAQLSSVRLPDGRPVPRLDELLDAWPEVRWNIDAKHDSVVDALLATLRSHDALDRVCVTSFNDRRIARIRSALGPQVCTTLAPATTGLLRLASVLPGPLGRLAAAPLAGFGAAQVPVREGPIPLVDARFVAAAHQRGLHVHVWTVDDPAEAHRLLDLGVDGLMTDRPSMLKAVLAERHAWFD